MQEELEDYDDLKELRKAKVDPKNQNGRPFDLVAAEVHHRVDLMIVVHGIVVEQDEALGFGVHSRDGGVGGRAVSPATLGDVLLVGVLRLANQQIGVFGKGIDFGVELFCVLTLAKKLVIWLVIRHVDDRAALRFHSERKR